MATVYDYSRDGVLASIEESLARLGQDRLDIVYVHDPDNYVAEALAGAFPALLELRDQGVISAVGAGMNQTAALETFARETDPDLFRWPAGTPCWNRGALATFLPLCEQRGIAVIAGGALNSGLLADPNPGTHYNYLPAPQPLIDRAQRLRAVCARHGVPLKAAAIQFPLAHPAVAAVLTGARQAAEVSENCALFDLPIPAGLWPELRAEGLLDERAPGPGMTNGRPGCWTRTTTCGIRPRPVPLDDRPVRPAAPRVHPRGPDPGTGRARRARPPSWSRSGPTSRDPRSARADCPASRSGRCGRLGGPGFGPR